MQVFEKHYSQLYIFFQASGSAEVLGPELCEATVESGLDSRPSLTGYSTTVSMRENSRQILPSRSSSSRWSAC
jgi:hypothetical protein